MTEKSTEVGPIVATAMIAIGVATVVWAVATNPRKEREDEPFLKVNKLEVEPATTAPSLPEVGPTISDEDWEKVLVTVEAIKTEGLLTSINAGIQVATVDAGKWGALSEDRQREIGRHLAVYCGRVGGSDEYKVEIVDTGGQKLGAYEYD